MLLLRRRNATRGTRKLQRKLNRAKKTFRTSNIELFVELSATRKQLRTPKWREAYSMRKKRGRL